MKHNIIFLDIDGVLNSLETVMTMCRKGRIWSPISIGYMEMLAEAIDARIVVSSAWRGYRDTEDLQKMITTYASKKLGDRVIGRTKQEDEMRPKQCRCRGDQIDDWLIENVQLVEDYVIIDDDRDMLKGQAPRFVNTSYLKGFGVEEYVIAMLMFNPSEETAAGIAKQFGIDLTVKGLTSYNHDLVH